LTEKMKCKERGILYPNAVRERYKRVGLSIVISTDVVPETISEQLKEQGFELDSTYNHLFRMKISCGEYIEEMRRASNLLRIAGFLTDAESVKMYKRMMNYIVEHLQLINKPEIIK